MVREILEVSTQPQEVEIFKRAFETLDFYKSPWGELNASSREGEFPGDFGRDQAYFGLEIIDTYRHLPLDYFTSESNRILNYLASHQKNGEIYHEHWVFYPGLEEKKKKFSEIGREIQEKGPSGYPELVYYGAKDSTPLFLILADEYLRVTKDFNLFSKLEPNIRSALEYLNRTLYLTAPPGFPAGWMDAADACEDQDGTVPQEELALCENQDLKFAANIRWAQRLIAMDIDPVFGRELLEEAQRLKEAFNRDFWMAEEGYIAQAIDQSGRQRGDMVITGAETLFGGIVNESYAPYVVSRVLQSDLWTPWGIRTRSSLSPNFDQSQKYQGGKIWVAPGNWKVEQGLKRYGFVKEADELSTNALRIFAFFGDFPENVAYVDGTDHPTMQGQSNHYQLWDNGAAMSLIVPGLGDQEKRFLINSLSQEEKTVPLVA